MITVFFQFQDVDLNHSRIGKIQNLECLNNCEVSNSSSVLINFFMCFFNLITKTYLRVYNFDPLKPHFYLVKVGFTREYIIFLISAQKHRLWVLVRTASPRWF